jgi:hypothetical protein
MLSRTINLSRTALTNFVRHHSHGGIPGEVRVASKNDKIGYATFSIVIRIDFVFIFILELAILYHQPIQAHRHVHCVLWIRTWCAFPRPQTSIVEEVNS